MHIVCAMFSRNLGGLEQSLIDYCEALSAQNHSVTAFIYPGALIEEHLRRRTASLNVNIVTMRNFGQWDIIAVKRFRRKLKDIRPDAIITFGNRAVSMARRAAKGIAPVIARTPNYSVKRLIGLDGIFHTTDNLREHIKMMGQPEEKLFHVPNMVNIPDEHKFSFKPFGKPPVIGTMGRFVKKKGLAEFIHALSRLRDMKVRFKAVIGGDGEEKSNLQTLVRNYGLQDHVTFLGWVENKKAFFDSIDIFCLPSLLEPFGIVLLEAFLHCKPIVTTDSEGPKEIASNGHDALVVPKGNYIAMAEALKEMVLDESRAQTYAINGLKTIKKRYDTKVVSEKMNEALKRIIERK